MNTKSLLFTSLILILGLQIGLAGNDPCSSTNLDPFSADLEIFDNSSNSDSGIPAPPYGGYAGEDIWFDFVMPPGGLVNLIITGGTMTDPAIAIYEGDCSNPKLLYNILDDNCDDDLGPAAILDELIPGQTFYIRVWAQNDSGNGTFSVFLSETTEYQPGFIVHSDASEDGDCILLTDDINSQHGCAWFELPIDFTQPFIHEMTANFGDKDFDGADGICLIYQSNGPDYCGISGGGIGASGMPNSAIFEFDTYQNGQYNDPYEDHCAFNLNGDMDHANSVEGPVILGNIEDGLDHSIEFHYDGTGGYELYFDGILQLSGSYDFINDIFGGENTAWWGYTAGTGALNNEHVICPYTEDIELGTQEYQEAFLCPGESFNGHSESGFYIDLEAGEGNCFHQINTYIEVYEENEPGLVEVMICEGETFEMDGNYYDQPGSYQLLQTGSNGCDSLVFLEISMPELDISIDGNGPISCLNPTVELNLNVFADPMYDYIDFYWETPDGPGYDWYFEASEAGDYTVTAAFYIGEYYCEVSTSTFLEIDSLAPEIFNLEDMSIDCNQIENNLYLDPDVNGNNLEFNWYLNTEWVSSETIIPVTEEGTYILEVINMENGCSSIDSAVISYSTDFLQIDLVSNQLDCQVDSFPVDISITGELDSLYWNFNGIFFSDAMNPVVNQPGIYSITAVSLDGCISRDTLWVQQDTLHPEVFTQDYIIPCDSTSIQANVHSDSIFNIIWEAGTFIADGVFNPVIADTGTYTFTVFDSSNHCSTRDSFNLSALGKSPETELHSEPITCYKPEVSIGITSDMEDLNYSWYLGDSLLSYDEELYVSTPGYYYFEAVSQSGCSTLDSIFVFQNTQHPIVELSGDTLNCDQDHVTLEASTAFGDSLLWLGPGGNTNDNSSWEIELGGSYLFQAWNTENGCTTQDSIDVPDLSFQPVFSLTYDTLNCHHPSTLIQFEIDTSIESLSWHLPSGNYLYGLQPLIEQGGWIDLHIEIDGPCDSDTSFFVAEDFTLPGFELKGETIDCLRPETTIQIESQESDIEYEIIDPDGEHFFTQSHTSDLPGVYYVSLTGKNGCTSQDSIEILAYLDPPEASIQSDGPITCSEPVAAIWIESEDDDLVLDWNVAYDPNSSWMIQATEAGIYQVEITNEHGCKDSLVLTMEAFLDLPNYEINGNDITCRIPQSTLQFQSSDSNLSIRWQDEHGNFLSDQSEFSTTTSGWYYLLAENEYGCQKSDSLLISEHTALPQISILSDNPLLVETYLDKRASIELEVKSEVPYELYWEPATGLSCSDCLSPQVLGDEITSYTVYVEDDYGCINEEKIDIRYKNKTIIQIPNVFSPHNQDALNDYFTLIANENVEIIEELKIFDRWGNLVFLNTNFPANTPELGWDGNFRGQLASKGVYVYVFRVRTIEGEVLIYAGDVTIL